MTNLMFKISEFSLYSEFITKSLYFIEGAQEQEVNSLFEFLFSFLDSTHTDVNFCLST